MEIKGDKRDNLTLPEYKAAMQKVECLEAEAKKLDKQNETLEQCNESLQKRASDLNGQVQQMRQEKRELSEQTKQLANKAYKLESGITEKTEEYRNIDSRLNSLKSKQKDIERNIHVYEEEPKWQLSDPTVFMSAKDYRTKIALPLVQKLKKVIVDLTLRCTDALENVKKYKNKSNTLQIRVNSLEKCLREQQTAISSLKQKEQLLEDVSAHLGELRYNTISSGKDRRMELIYEKGGDYLVPNLIPNQEPEGELRKFGLMRKSYLENYRRGIYSGLLLSGELKKHLLMIQEQAEEIVRKEIIYCL